MNKPIEILKTDKGGKPTKINRFYDITDDDMALGLRYLKSKVNQQYKKLVFRWHPDTGLKSYRPIGRNYINGWTFNQIKKVHDMINSLTIMPLTLDNMESVLELSVGKTTSNYPLPSHWE